MRRAPSAASSLRRHWTASPRAGLRYTKFHSTALCSPTRAALITGRNHHAAGFGVVSSSDRLPRLRQHHRQGQGHDRQDAQGQRLRARPGSARTTTRRLQASQAGPFDQWPIGMGFEYFYGFVGGDTSQWQPNLFRNTTAIYPIGQARMEPDHRHGRRGHRWHEADQRRSTRSKPFFCYYVPGGTHAPHHPTPEWIKKISEMHLFDNGWNKLRETDLREPEEARRDPAGRQAHALAGRTLQQWDTLTADEKKLFIRQVDVYAAYLAYTDHEIGRVIQAVEDMGKLNNTLIIYISGDNGASAEGTLNGTPNEVATFNGVEVPVEDQLQVLLRSGDPTGPSHIAVAWSWAFDTPFRGPSRSPRTSAAPAQGMCISWPGHIKDGGGIRNQFHHVIDIVPTILEAAASPRPLRSTASSSTRSKA